MGTGIATMHYTGMAAMRMSPPIQFDPTLYVLSILIAIGASVAALWITFQLRSINVANLAIKRILAALIMRGVIAGMHYTGMAAANFAPNSICYGNPNQIGNLWMAATIAACTLLFLAATMLVSVFDARLTSSTAKLARSLLSTNALLTEEVNERSRAEQALHQRANSSTNRNTVLVNSTSMMLCEKQLLVINNKGRSIPKALSWPRVEFKSNGIKLFLRVD